MIDSEGTSPVPSDDHQPWWTRLFDFPTRLFSGGQKNKQRQTAPPFVSASCCSYNAARGFHLDFGRHLIPAPQFNTTVPSWPYSTRSRSGLTSTIGTAKLSMTRRCNRCDCPLEANVTPNKCQARSQIRQQ